MAAHLRLFVLACVVAGASCGRDNCGDTKIEDAPMPSQTLADYEDPDADEIFLIDGGDVPWGDYGSILVHGMTAHLGREAGADRQVQLERTGPYVPPITFPGIGDIIVTTEMKEAMEAAGFRGISFRPVKKVRIVEVPWHTWDWEAEDPPYYPEEGEPEGYILDKKHSPAVSEAIGELWEVVISDGAQMERVQVGEKSWNVEFRYVPGTWADADLFSVPVNRHKYASHRAKRWFEEHFPRWTSFKSGTRH